ncbi:unnamed protein product, partial [Brenthis ino]
MKKSHMYNNVNRPKNTLYNHLNRNIVYPTVLFNPVILNKKEFSTGVEIIEIKSDEEHYTQENNLNTQSNASCKANDFEDDFAINRSARERRNLRQEQKYDSKTNILSEAAFSQACTDFYGIDCHDRGDRIPSMFPLLSNSTSTETSSDDVEVFLFDNAINDIYWNSDDSYDSHKAYINYKKPEKQTVWIYSQKNRQHLFESNDANNIPSQETSYSSFTDDDDPREDFETIRRIATPIPTYIPRLNLPSSPTLPTVTEVTEPNKSSLNITESRQTDKQNINIHNIKPVNTWFLTDQNVETTQKRTVNHKHKLSTLSQREKRRKKLKEIQEQEVLDLKEDSSPNIDSKIILQTKSTSPKLQENSKNTNKFEVTANAINTDINNENIDINSLQKPQIKISPKLLQTKKHISDPIEKIEGNWIDNDSNNDEEKAIEVLDCDLNTSDVEKCDLNTKKITSQNDKLLVRNMSLLKPAEWTQYSALANSVPPLQLSFSTDYENEGIPWFKRIYKFVRCCK